MSVALETVKGISWSAFFKFISQCFSWVVTIIIARLLVPEDYALMTMATIYTGYAGLFSELGLGAAIIQKNKTTDSELSSVFWIGFICSVLFGIACILLAYPTALTFNEDRLIPITQVVCVIFLLNGLVIVPANLMRRNMQFKELGIIEMYGVIISSASMLVIAKMGGGVWTFIGGHIIRDAVKVAFYYKYTRWFPSLHFDFSEAKQYLRFGLAMSFGGSFHYISEKADRFFAGIFWAPQMLGFYSFALQLSELPNQKIRAIVNQVSFSAFSKLQDKKDEFNSLYLQITKITTALVTPLYLGGFWVGEELFSVILGDKWNGAIFFFKALCLVQVIKSLEATNLQVHAAQGRARLFFILRAGIGILLPITFYFTVKHGGDYGIIIPWFTTYLIFQCVLIYLALKWLNLGAFTYFRNLLHPICAACLMSLALYSYQLLTGTYGIGIIPTLIIKIVLGATVYIGYFVVFDKKLITSIKNLRKK